MEFSDATATTAITTTNSNSSSSSSSPPPRSLSPTSSPPHPPPPAGTPPAVIVSPCAACKILRRRCAEKCVFTPYFPTTEPAKFAIAHKVFGASNISKFLQELPESQRADAVSSIVYEASARIRDPVYGCAGAVYHLQKQVSELQAQLAKAQADLVNMQCQQSGCCKPPTDCGYTYVNETVWTPSGRVVYNPDCNSWSNDQQQLCYSCSSCKAGVLGSLRKSWRKVSVINIVVLIILVVILYVVGCAAFRNNCRIDNDDPYGEARMTKAYPSRIQI